MKGAHPQDYHTQKNEALRCFSPERLHKMFYKKQMNLKSATKSTFILIYVSVIKIKVSVFAEEFLAHDDTPSKNYRNSLSQIIGFVKGFLIFLKEYCDKFHFPCRFNDELRAVTHCVTARKGDQRRECSFLSLCRRISETAVSTMKNRARARMERLAIMGIIYLFTP